MKNGSYGSRFSLYSVFIRITESDMNTSGNNSGISIGVLKLNTNFPRLAGDIGNPASFDYPVQYVTVDSAVPGNITVATRLPDGLQKEFIEAAGLLINNNVSIITTTCGFLSTIQHQLTQLSNIPVICSALELLPLLKAVHGGAHRIGILTFNKDTLNENHTAGITAGAVEGLLPGDSLRKVISDDLSSLDEEQALENVISACDRLLTTAPELSAILLECTNLSPYKHIMRERTGLPVYDIIDAVHWLLWSRTTKPV